MLDIQRVGTSWQTKLKTRSRSTHSTSKLELSVVTQKNSQTKTQSKLPYADTLGKQYVSPAEAVSWQKRFL